MTRILLAITIWFGTALACSAGAWMRSEGEGFLSLGFRAFEPQGTGSVSVEQNLFIEYGLGPRLTLGASVNHTSGEKGEGTLFLRLPLRNDDRPAKIAAEVGIGAVTTDFASFDPYLKTGLSWGRGVTIGGRGGWVNVDGAVQWASSDAPPLFKLDGTLGLALSDRLAVMGQGFFEGDENGESVTVVPSLIYTPKQWPIRLVFGLEYRTGRDANTGLRFGVWREF